jgi:hypothetical protein
MSKQASTAPEAQIAAVGPTGPAPTQPQGVPAGGVQLGDSYVQPLADPAATAGERRKAPFAFVDGVLVAQAPVVITPQRAAQPDALAAASATARR